MNSKVDILLEERTKGDENEELGTVSLFKIPNRGDFVKKGGEQYKVHHVVHQEHGVRLIVS